MSAFDVTTRYVTSDFRTSPLMALTDLLGLKRFSQQIKDAPDFYGSILSGIVVYRHLSRSERMGINYAVQREMAPCTLQDRLMILIGDLSVQPYWCMWSLSDEEVKEFYEYNKDLAAAVGQFNPVDLPPITVATLASGLYLVSKKGAKATLTQSTSSVAASPLVLATARKFGVGPNGLRALGGAAVAALIVISGLNIMAKNNSAQAKKELAARGLLVYKDL